MSLFYEPFYIFDDMNCFFDEAFGMPSAIVAPVSHRHRGSSSAQRLFKPKLDLYENADGTVSATFEVPGLKREDISIDLHDDRLTISGERTSSFETKPNDDLTSERTSDSTDQEKQDNVTSSSPSYIIRERSIGKFSRSVDIPKGTKPESIKASMANGLLTITFPKKAPETEPKSIQIA
ncbi:HSP20-like chaperone [Cantharellus anzutake]|uniref:HSP20-like chaperone n=1 Tax=Cantharellus anzutake TaxID=1750568 RepID=UPI001906ED15|nr:HSP20-like chaperone [Cantharellus anzutake]KAF8339180.1 HSP20-like chaperone [Cantharellus anzutake]